MYLIDFRLYSDTQNRQYVAIKIGCDSSGGEGVLEHEALALKLIRQQGCNTSMRESVGKSDSAHRIPTVIFYGPPGLLQFCALFDN
jgi:hypothetical protein